MLVTARGSRVKFMVALTAVRSWIEVLLLSCGSRVSVYVCVCKRERNKSWGEHV